jgi:threonine/homoserine/homoserine lactone efflux protein
VASSILAFLAISVMVIATPGPDTALTIRNVFAGGRGAGIATALGVAFGQLVWAAATSLGLVALLLASEPVFHALRLLGAVYLVYLGLQSLRSAFGASKESAAYASEAGRRTLLPMRAFCQGLINDLANPKMAVFFASVLPQFAQPGQGMFSQLLVLGAVFAVLTFVWLSLYTVVLGLAGKWLQRSSVRRAIDGMAGAALVGLGIRVATADR